ncbi:ImmA/IrrE family metallo-endopeptidase [Corynebacterium macginleyi]|uniref:ImmA/IrrE family metallo-endopeptidase n=1 Tax=Corynebacterium macginleyi TaxID=38290 RepID=UPI00190D5CD2|nr:ImmA/IrrE family metallo-endopeptidase [Corynebacterium macginleyi]MBK4145351.1 ImmA/IrrE family metallo-endopeptidase [Corynebacterium macginleyi]MBK4179762.1 ImmA/IrrE family metallo-endopeptidase [Corynebacterium macginleyi]
MLVWQAARKCATEVRENYGLSTPVDLQQLCEQLGISVWIGDLKGASGLILKEPGKDPDIYLERTDSHTRQRFTLAHELGHYFERLESSDDEYSFRDEGTFREERSNKYGLMEFYADEFAGELLMPEEEFLECYDNHGITGAASHFRVSPSAVKKRKERLEKSRIAQGEK